MSEEVITIDSDEEESGPSTSKAMQFNPANYSDLVRKANRPGPASRKAAAAIAANGGPKRPSPLPPFGLFSQEKRPEVARDHPEFSFGEIGRRLGELWHALTEGEKNTFRKRAQDLHRQKLVAWNRQQSVLQQQQQQRAGQVQQRGAAPARPTATTAGGIQPRRTNGYTIFCSEMRKRPNFSNMPPSIQSTRLAETWKKTPATIRNRYDERAKRFNENEAQKALIARRRQQGAVPAPMVPTRGRGRGRGRGSITRPIVPSIRMASVASSISPRRQMNAVRARQGTPALPSSISISRIDTAPGPSNARLSQLPASTQLTVQRGPLQRMTRQQIVQQRPVVARPTQYMQQQTQVHPPVRRGPGRPPARRGLANSMLVRGGRGGGRGAGRGGYVPILPAGIPPHSQIQQQHGAYMPLRNKRGPGRPPSMNGSAAAAAMNAAAAKRLRLIPASVPNLSGVGRPATFASLGPLDKICRLCATTYQGAACIYKISESPQLMEKLELALDLRIDVDDEREMGYPNIVCRKCCENVLLMCTFKEQVRDGLQAVHDFISRRKESEGRLEEANFISVEEVNPLEIGDDASILPDLEGDQSFPRPVSIKKEMHAGLSTSHMEVEEEVDPLTAGAANPEEDAFDFVVSTENAEEEEDEGGEGIGFVLGEATSIADFESVPGDGLEVANGEEEGEELLAEVEEGEARPEDSEAAAESENAVETDGGEKQDQSSKAAESDSQEATANNGDTENSQSDVNEGEEQTSQNEEDFEATADMLEGDDTAQDGLQSDDATAHNNGDGGESGLELSSDVAPATDGFTTEEEFSREMSLPEQDGDSPNQHNVSMGDIEFNEDFFNENHAEAEVLGEEESQTDAIGGEDAQEEMEVMADDGAPGEGDEHEEIDGMKETAQEASPMEEKSSDMTAVEENQANTQEEEEPTTAIEDLPDQDANVEEDTAEQEVVEKTTDVQEEEEEATNDPMAEELPEQDAVEGVVTEAPLEQDPVDGEATEATEAQDGIDGEAPLDQEPVDGKATDALSEQAAIDGEATEALLEQDAIDEEAAAASLEQEVIDGEATNASSDQDVIDGESKELDASSAVEPEATIAETAAVKENSAEEIEKTSAQESQE